jgi:hypothetical protein
VISGLRRFVLFVGIPVAVAHAAYDTTGCGGGLAGFDELNDPSDDASLTRCRKLAREIYADGGRTKLAAHEGYAAYWRCTDDAGLR